MSVCSNGIPQGFLGLARQTGAKFLAD